MSPRRTFLGATALVILIGCASTRIQTRNDQIVPVVCARPESGLAPAFVGLQISSGGQVGKVHSFHRDISLPADTVVDVVRMPTGALIYEARTVVAYKNFEAFDIAALREQFRTVADATSMSGQHLIDRRAVGYRRASFRVDYALMNTPPVGDPVPQGEDRFVSYTQWRIETGWEDGAIVTEAKDGQVVYRFNPTRLYANLSSSMRLPRWPRARNVSAGQRSIWEAFLCDLHAHEMLHVETGRAVAANVLNELVGLRETSREQLEAKYYLAWKSGFRWGREEDVRVDQYSGHGPVLKTNGDESSWRTKLPKSRKAGQSRHAQPTPP